MKSQGFEPVQRAELSQATMAALPTEMIAEILSRLPVKLLIRFTCVCKSWFSLIKSPNFIKLHLNQTLISNPNHHILQSLHCAELNPNHNHLYFSEFYHPLKSSQGLLLGSCNGVVCISDESYTDVYLCNPLTKSHLKLPPNLNQNPNFSAKLFGFGYDSKNDDYKVLRVMQGYENNTLVKNEAELYSLKQKSWKCVEGIPYYLLYIDYHGVLVNEAVNFVVITEEKRGQRKYVASFDLGNTKFVLFDFPDFDDFVGNNLSNFELYLRELNGCLCLMVNFHTNDFEHLLPPIIPFRDRMLNRADLWVMKEYGKIESWVRLYRIRDPGSFRCVHLIRPVIYSEDGRRILLEIDILRFVWYDLESKKVEKIETHGLSKEVGLDAKLFVGSLVLFDNTLLPERESLPKKRKQKKDLDNFLSMGFKLRL